MSFEQPENFFEQPLDHTADHFYSFRGPISIDIKRINILWKSRSDASKVIILYMYNYIIVILLLVHGTNC